MTTYWTAEHKGFIDAALWSDDLPADAIEISGSEHATLLAGINAGKHIVIGAAGRPALLDPPPPTDEQIKSRLIATVQRHIDSTAQQRGYDSIYTACTYADEPAVAKFQAEGIAARRWRSQVWAYCHQVLEDVQTARRSMPTIAQLISELPVIAWPS